MLVISGSLSELFLPVGDVIRLDVRGSWPYAHNPFTGTFPTGYQRSSGGTCRLHTGGEYQAYLLFAQRPPASDR